MEIDFEKIDPKVRYKILTSTIIPRPIALVTTRGEDGVDNAAPFSFFNVFGEDPPIIILGLQSKNCGEKKSWVQKKTLVTGLVEFQLLHI